MAEVDNIFFILKTIENISARQTLHREEILLELNALAKQISALSDQLASAVKLIVGDLNPIPPVVSLKFRNLSTMAIVTSISPTATDVSEVGVEDQNGNPLPVGSITWGAPIGEAAATDMTSLATPDADGLGFDFQASSTAPSGGETFTIPATFTPAGGGSPVTAVLSIVLAPVVSPVTGLQFNLLKGT